MSVMVQHVKTGCSEREGKGDGGKKTRAHRMFACTQVHSTERERGGGAELDFGVAPMHHSALRTFAVEIERRLSHLLHHDKTAPATANMLHRFQHRHQRPRGALDHKHQDHRRLLHVCFGGDELGGPVVPLRVVVRDSVRRESASGIRVLTVIMRVANTTGAPCQYMVRA